MSPLQRRLVRTTWIGCWRWFVPFVAATLAITKGSGGDLTRTVGDFTVSSLQLTSVCVARQSTSLFESYHPMQCNRHWRYLQKSPNRRWRHLPGFSSRRGRLSGEVVVKLLLLGTSTIACKRNPNTKRRRIAQIGVCWKLGSKSKQWSVSGESSKNHEDNRWKDWKSHKSKLIRPG
jgi:hypothetical protein